MCNIAEMRLLQQFSPINWFKERDSEQTFLCPTLRQYNYFLDTFGQDLKCFQKVAGKHFLPRRRELKAQMLWSCRVYQFRQINSCLFLVLWNELNWILFEMSKTLIGLTRSRRQFSLLSFIYKISWLFV